MTVQTVGPLKVAMFIDEDDMHIHGIGDEGIDLEVAKSLARDAFISSGVSPGRQIEIIAFTGKNGIMVFAEVIDELSGEPEEYKKIKFYAFNTLDDAVAAAQRIESPYPQAGFTYFEDKYYLNIKSGNNDNPHIYQIITEYGAEVECNMLFFAHMLEHGKSISKTLAFEKLRLIK